MSRRALAEQVFSWIGDPPLKLIDLQAGWPAMGTFRSTDGNTDVALHVAPAANYFRAPHEFRFQNPGQDKPVVGAAGLPILLGVAQGPAPILIGLDGRTRIGRTTRFSILFNKNIIPEALANGVAKYISSTSETIYAFKPTLFGSFMEIVSSGEVVETTDLVAVTKAAGVLDEETPAAAERARRATKVLIRQQAFSQNVRNAYSGQCALCGISARLVVGAHIYPASAPHSPDTVWNGMALCQNHHAAFDNHDIWIDPSTLKVKLNPEIIELAKSNPAVAVFLKGTFEKLNVPSQVAHHPRLDMFEKRYVYYPEKYAWITL